MSRVIFFAALVALFPVLCVGKGQPLPLTSNDPPGPDEPCVKDAYPPDASTMVDTYTVDLDEAPEKRWLEIVTLHKDQLKTMITYMKNMLSFLGNGTVIPFVEKELGNLASTLPYPYGGELKGISSVLGVPLGDVVLYNIFYEIFSVCTSIIGQDKNGTLYHARNLDFGLFMGWDVRNDTWEITEMLRPMVVNVEYTRGGKVIFKAVHFAGYIGVLSGLKPNAFTLTINERYAGDGGYVGIVEWIMGDRNQSWMGFLTRDTLQNATSFTEAVSMLTNTRMLAPAYFIVAGTQSGEGIIITRDRDKSDHPWRMNPSNGTWYILETNYDHWKAPLFVDDRRTPANKCMLEMGQTGMSLPGLFNVLSTKPVLNKLTTYTTLMQVGGHQETYRRTCADPCWPW